MPVTCSCHADADCERFAILVALLLVRNMRAGWSLSNQPQITGTYHHYLTSLSCGTGPLKWVIKGKDLEKQMSLRLTSLQQAVSTPQ